VETSEVNYAPLHQANGFAFYMTSTSAHKDAVWKFIKYMNSPEVSIKVVTDSRGGYQPWRTTHTTDLDGWTKVGWNRDDAQNYVTTIIDSANHPNASLDLRIPGLFKYYAVLETHLSHLLDAVGPPNVHAEMIECAKDLEDVTNENQRGAQQSAYLNHLGVQPQ
jgi:multiple sugar transport system substrate-binding protein